MENDCASNILRGNALMVTNVISYSRLLRVEGLIEQPSIVRAIPECHA